MGLRTPLFDWHVQAGAKIVEFGGWDMPVLYSSINDEHVATRTRAGLFDVSHMGRIWFSGRQATVFLDHLMTNQVSTMKEGQVRYSLLLNESAGILDDVLIYRLERRYLVVVNASNRAKFMSWVGQWSSGFDVAVHDETDHSAMIAIQGPLALDQVPRVVDFDPHILPFYTCSVGPNESLGVLFSRTGYTGEDGVEIIGPPNIVTSIWKRILADGASAGVCAAGLGARDTLRLEASMPLYGHELSESIDPIQAGLPWAVKEKSKDFIGKQALLAKPADRPIRVGLKIAGRRIARENFPMLDGDQHVGRISSGTFSPTLQESIAMGYVRPPSAVVGRELFIDIRGVKASARVVPMPFYRRTSATGAKT